MSKELEERARELFYSLKPECQAHADGCKGCAESIAEILAMLTQLQAEARLACSEQVRTAASMQPDAAVRRIILAIADGLQAAAPATKEGE